jgi:poly-gamma-glutamate synthesis protein (capsule biosynthesis protein)
MKALISFIISLFTTTTLVSPAVMIKHTPTPTLIPVVSLGLMGDLGLGRHITSTARAKNDFSWSFQNINQWVGGNDLNRANLESPIIANCPEGKTGTFTFCGDPRFIPQLSPFILNLNNNHILNYGQSGLEQTQKYLPNSFYSNFYTKKINGITFGFLGYDFVTYPNQSTSEIIQKIKQLDTQVDWLVISIHWGNEYLPQPEKWRINFAHQMVEAGADIIHGHHPHVWQGTEVYQGKPIFYSFGNFIFDQSWSYETSHSQIARLTLTRDKVIKQELFPIAIKFNSQPALMP